jgi:hypothetical protein
MEYMMPLLPLIPANPDGRTCLHDWIDAIEKARDYSSEIEEDEFLRGMQAAGRLTKM